MTINLSKFDANEALDTIEALFKKVMYPFAKPGEVYAIQQHLAFLRAMTTFDTTCKIYTDPATQLTRITIDITPPEKRQGIIRQ